MIRALAVACWFGFFEANFLQFVHHRLKFGDAQLLLGITHSNRRIGMHFYHEAICATGFCNTGKRFSNIAAARTVANIDNHREM